MEGSITKKDIVKKISERTGIQQTIVARVVQMTLDSIIDVISNEGNIELRNFGVFTVVQRAPRTARNPRTGEKVHVPPKRAVKFYPGKELENRVSNSGGASGSGSASGSDSDSGAGSSPSTPPGPGGGSSQE